MNKFVVDTGAIRCNALDAKREYGGKLCVVVKANAYGHGAENVVPFLEDIADYFAVANVKEGVKVRAYTYKPILVLGAFEEGDLGAALSCDLVLSIYNFESLRLVLGLKSDVKVHIKVNTGMNRLGFSLGELKEVKDILSKNNHIKVLGMYSHIFDNSEQNLSKQKELFDRTINEFCGNEVSQDFITHLSASGGMKLLKGNYKMLRLGLSLYGYPKGKRALSIYSKVAKITKLKKGDKVGYDGIFTADRDMEIATIPLGYYDGVPLRLSKGGYVLINNKRYYVIGKTCMDMFMIKADDSIKVGDNVKVFWDAKMWAKIKGTHEWEILTSLKSDRLKVVLM